MSSLVPIETDEEVITSLRNDGDEHGLWLFQLIHIKSCDVEFTWKTSMLLHQIGTWAEEAETVEDFIQLLKYYRHGKMLYEKCKDHVNTIFQYFHENPRE